MNLRQESINQQAAFLSIGVSSSVQIWTLKLPIPLSDQSDPVFHWATANFPSPQLIGLFLGSSKEPLIRCRQLLTP
ncbi:hypothetical protein T265_02266 [Opisthorchis viverrini]|uniref:Uncharacterized protein n=1 Tax=Opisthorchis viverrini TaxID=6198 RepID=A0A074ZWI8_OPIVI|nr:hypothetical protein T265_02266 [Opisthorchis viverrini]KER31496.1 hypothetical protein T265_02266 [Opisthorchis viverrini]